VGALVEDATGAATHPATVEALHRRSGGNPLFAAELARLLATQGRLGGSGPGRLGGDLAGAVVPDTIRAVLGRRLARLDPDCRDLLQLAAVAGVRFGVELLARAAGRDRAEVLRLLAEAEAGRVVAGVPASVDGWAFTHTLVRDVLYEGLGVAERPGAHLRVAEALLALHGDDERQLAELAHHFLRAAPGAGGQRRRRLAAAGRPHPQGFRGGAAAAGRAGRPGAGRRAAGRGRRRLSGAGPDRAGGARRGAGGPARRGGRPTAAPP